MKIIIAGNGKIGTTLTAQLSAEGHDLVLIDSNRDVLNTSVEKYDVMAVHGNCATMPALKQAGAGDADLLIATASADEINMLSCLTAHEVNPKLHTIARIRNPEYSDQIYSMRETFALSMVVNPEKQAAMEIERLLKYPGFLKRDTFAKGRVEIVELRVDASSKLCDVSLAALNNIIKCKVLVCAVLRNGVAVTPHGNFTIKEGDRIFVTAPSNELAELLRNLGIITHKVKKVLIAGGGRVSYYLAEFLEKSGIAVEIIEKNPERCNELAKLLHKTSVVFGDATNQSLLRSERIESYDAVVTATGMDEVNMIISLFASRNGVPQVITKLSHMGNAGILGALFSGSTVCPRELCCNNIVRYVRAMQNQSGAALSVHSIADGETEATEFRVDESTKHIGQKLRDIKLRHGVLVVSISRGYETEIPNGDSSFEIGDAVVVCASKGTVIRRLNDIFTEN